MPDLAANHTHLPRKPRMNSNWRHFFMALPSFLLVFWAALVYFDIEGKAITVVMMLLLAIAFCKEEHIRYSERSRN